MVAAPSPSTDTPSALGLWSSSLTIYGEKNCKLELMSPCKCLTDRSLKTKRGLKQLVKPTSLQKKMWFRIQTMREI